MQNLIHPMAALRPIEQKNDIPKKEHVEWYPFTEIIQEEVNRMAVRMPQWRVVFLLCGRQSEQIVGASDAWQAGELVKKQYAGQRVSVIHVEKA